MQYECFLIESKKLERSDWHVDWYQHWGDFLWQDDDFSRELHQIISLVNDKKLENDFRLSIEIKTSQFLLAVLPAQKRFLLASKFLGTELSLSHLIMDAQSDAQSEVELFKKHINSIASIPVENTPPVIDQVTYRWSLPDLTNDKILEVENDTQSLVKEVVEKVNEYRSGIFEKMSDFGLDLTANYMLIRIHLLKFLAVLPSLDHDKNGTEVKKIFLETLRRLIDDSSLAKEKKLKGQKRGLPKKYIFPMKIVQSLAKVVPAKILVYLIRYSVAKMATRFIAGEDITKVRPAIDQLMQSGRDATLDQLGELVVSEREADEYMNSVLEIIQGLQSHIEVGSTNSAGILRAHVSIKVSALCSDFKPHAFDYTYNLVAPRLIRILKAAKKHQVFINIDAEHYHYRDLVFEIYKKVLLDTQELHDFADTGIVVQAYLRDGHQHFEQVVELAKQRAICMPIRVVKGAYWDAETVEARAHNFNAPQFLNKEETDIHFRQIIILALENYEHIQLAVASHNIQDHCFAESYRNKYFSNAPKIEHQCLHMTYEGLSEGLAKMGWATRNYIPIGNLLVGMAYLVRRIMENSSQVGILTIMRSHTKAFDHVSPLQTLRNKQSKSQIAYDSAIKLVDSRFRNIYPVRMYLKRHFNYFKSIFNVELDKLKKGNSFLEGDISVHSSSYPELQLGKVKYDSPEEVSQKIEFLFKGFLENTWKENFNNARYVTLFKFADILLQKREELTTLIMMEAGKTVEEALADVDEAIDFVQFYAKAQIDSVLNNSELRPKGVFGVIAPWNFPLAIPCGMTVAALATGNSVILKPAEQTPLISLKMVELAYLAGVPEEVLQISIGQAETGKAIVSHDLVSGIVFTGSKAVGESIYYQLKGQFTSDRYPFKPVLKTVITEMGGKNAVIVTNNCELDETVEGIIYSAFAHSGQKCSAASRIIIDNQVKESFVNRFVDAVRDLKVGVSDDFSSTVNPLITEEDQLRVKEMVKRARTEVQNTGGKILLDESQKEYPGFCVGPAIFEVNADIALSAKSVAQTEIFGPVVHVIGYDDIEQAVEIFNSTQYALTGGVFSQSQDDIDYLMPRLQAGNIYINRSNTGARVAIEPFGGFKMSGTGPKAGSAQYLRAFNRIEKSGTETHHDVKWGEHSLPSMVKNSGLHLQNRINKTISFVDSLVSQFEVHFNHVSEEQKQQLISLGDYLKSPMNNLEQREIPNRYVPGQLSFNKISLGVGAVAMFVGSKLDVVQISYLTMNLMIGNGVTVICQNEEAYTHWNNILRLAMSAGFSNFNFQVLWPSLASVQKLLEREYAIVAFDETLFFNNSINNSLIKDEDILLQMAMTPKFNHFLRKVIIMQEQISGLDWDEYLQDLTLARSYAINTMRHGAPLEINL